MVWVVIVGCAAADARPAVEPIQPLPAPSTSIRAAPVRVKATPLPPIMELRDTRPRPTRRAFAALENERQRLEQYLAGAAQPAPATVHDRLAEAYVQLRKLGVEGASRAAILQYETVLREAPAYEDTDAVLYYLGIEDEAIRDNAGAERRYAELVQRHPDSVYVPLAEFAIGELELARGTSEPAAYRSALAAYLAVLEYPDSRIVPAARSRLLEVNEKLAAASQKE
ncbi:MAG TPA: hypothetical protein VGH28_31560 [Polyangiaceae bacterium]